MKETYTQREWDRVVGWGVVPEEYAKKQPHEEAYEEAMKANEDVPTDLH